MAAVEHLDDLPMTPLEAVLKKCLAERPDIAGRVLSSGELTEYVLWMARTYGSVHGKTAKDMLPFFTPGNSMTRLAEEVSDTSFSAAHVNRLAREMAVQAEESFIAPGQSISIGRMLRYYPSSWHTTTYFNVYFAFSGDCPIHFENEVIHLKRGSVLIVAPGIVHATPCFSDDAVLVFYMMRAGTFKSVFWNQLGNDNLLSKFFRLALDIEQATSYIHFDTQDDPEIRHLLLEIYREHQEDQLYSSQIVDTLMRLFFLRLLRRYEGTARLPRSESFFWKHQFSAILSYIQTHYRTATLKEIADRFNYSTKQVGRIVADCTGETFSDLIRGMKMRRAAELLRDHKYSPELAAEAVGYATVNSFYRAFTDYYGRPPLVWLAENQEDPSHESA